MIPSFTRQQLLIIAVGIIAIIVVLLIFGLSGKERLTPVHLEIWGVYDDQSFFQELIDEYEKKNEHVSITYREKNYDEYENSLLNSFAEDTQPDVWFMHNTWLSKYKTKIKTAPSSVLTFAQFRESFVDVAEYDLTDENEVYGIPLYVDTLALYYNKDLFNSAGISSPPETWDGLIEDIGSLTQKNQWGGIDKAGVAMGTAENINRSTDILALLMLQNGTTMVNDSKTAATFNQSIYSENETFYPGRDAMRFYTDFANASKTVYTWNRQMPYSIDAFIEGKTAMMFNYSHHIATIEEKAPYLNFAVASMPQIENRDFDVNYANYWALTVSKKSQNYSEAWKFIVWLSQKENHKKYLEISKKPTARRDLVEWQKEDLELGVFANQSLSARSWYQIDSDAIESLLAEAIESVILGENDVNSAVEKAENQTTLLMKN